MRKWILALVIVISLGSGLVGGSLGHTNTVKGLEHGGGY